MTREEWGNKQAENFRSSEKHPCRICERPEVGLRNEGTCSVCNGHMAGRHQDNMNQYCLLCFHIRTEDPSYV